MKLEPRSSDQSQITFPDLIASFAYIAKGICCTSKSPAREKSPRWAMMVHAKEKIPAARFRKKAVR